ncbi:scarecrow-like protein 32-like [Hibiscus syriacus]|uniref:Scarecrow-like protein 32-like n=1 Tax=Hibiscus syriacus TaxID=106335 RepID=A0A6A2WNF0_HIBSY|nr:scarecrow-like protein 32-like [Hibiscus syriacus]
MAVCCDLEVDVNGEETFLLDKVKQTIGKSTGAKRSRVIFHDFPGGAGNFELISSLFEKIERSVEEIGAGLGLILWALKHGQDLQQAATSSALGFGSRAIPKAEFETRLLSSIFVVRRPFGFESQHETQSSRNRDRYALHSRSEFCFVQEFVRDSSVVLNLNISKSSRSKLEDMIGSQLDQATLDNLLIPSPYGTSYMYDVNLVLKFLKAFLRRDRQSSPIRTKKVGSLIDSYIAEVAPDPYLKPSKFRALVTALPDSARDSEDELYHSIDIYLEMLATPFPNAKFGSKSAVQALASRQLKLKNFLQGTNHTDSSCKFTENEKLDISADNEKLREHLQGMQSRVMELEKVCTKCRTRWPNS